MTHASARLEADYNTLPEDVQDRFTRLMEQADIAGPHDYKPLMDQIALLVGLPEGDIRECACSCVCSRIFDANNENAHVIEYGEGYNLGRHQCPRCADWHRETA
ncbi:hypothetical protein [Streptomyces sp. SID161]|uniref:hypothetical protein n=1 Tax=Streptomyces sp. SID161 TaxID=2690251 RepID=UPI00136A7F1A|nr:hypothetical protein [Streptomyces sp. SID161]MYW49634.1 hypothetical protein [Streptomyces sp. SID161]